MTNGDHEELIFLSQPNTTNVLFFLLTTKYLIFIEIISEIIVRLKKIQNKKECKDQESIQPSTTPDQGYQWESDNFTIRHHK